MRKIRHSFYWDRVCAYIIIPILFVIVLITGIIYIPPRVIENHKKILAQVQMEKEAEWRRELAIFNEELKKREKKEKEEQILKSASEERQNVQKSTLEYETTISNKKYRKGTCVEDEEYGVGRVVNVYGFEISTKEGWNFNYMDVENNERKITVISPKRYKKLLKNSK